MPQRLNLDPTLPISVSRFMRLSDNVSKKECQRALEQAGVAEIMTKQMSEIYIDNLDDLGNDQTNWYDVWDDTESPDRGYLYFISADILSGTTVNIFQINGANQTASGYYKIAVSYVSGYLPTLKA